MKGTTFTIRLQDKFSPVLDKIRNSVSDFTSRMDKARSMTHRFNNVCKQLQLPNPEVVAPLDRLRRLVTPQTTTAPSLPAEITLRADGRSLVAVLDRQLFFNQRVKNK